ncbi:MAG: Hpt domain-containing protein [Hyphomicrobiales bacterium]|nr:Hpt domain-containing protein [Hyphomicrobiales bacterium]
MPDFAKVISKARAPQQNHSAGDAIVVDLVHLSRQSLGDRALETELLGLFERQAAQIVERLTSLDLENKYRADLAHTLKGSARTIGAFGVADAAEAYENAARQNAADLDLELEAVDRAVEKARKAIGELLMV